MTLLTLDEVADRLRLTRDWTYKLVVRRGELPYVNLGGKSIRVREEDLEAWLEAKTERGEGRR